MKFKRGVTFSIILVAIVIMMIVISTASIMGTRSITTANFEEYKSAISRLSNNINEYYISNNKLPVLEQTVDTNNLSTEFKNYVASKGDNVSSLKIVDISLVKDATIENGTGDITTKDIYLVSEDTQNVYYLGGFRYNGEVYYSF